MNNKLAKNRFSAIDDLLNKEFEKNTFPGAVIGIVTKNKLIYKKALGFAQTENQKREMAVDTVFGLASLTKVVATTSAVMKLIEDGKINLWDYLKEYFPEISEGKEGITIYHLMTHTSGYQAIVKLWEKDLSYEEKIDYILNLELENEIGKIVNYSDPNFILLGELVRRVTGKNLHKFTQEEIFTPLGMKKTAFNPLDNLKNIKKSDVAATEYCDWRERMIIGEVHDENAYSLGGISGHAGLFSTIDDLSRFVKMILNKGKLNEKKIFSELTINTMIQNWTENLGENRALGWDLINNFRSSGGILFSDKTFGHTGFTGTSIWIDPEINVGVILLTNRVHPTRDNVQIISLRPRLHNLVAATLNKLGIIEVI
ncbi:MAG: serine hydrolase domain-containing protein [Bacillota bacterium]